MMKFKVCHFISGDLWAGAEVMAFHLINDLKTVPNIDLFVILLNEGRLSQELEKVGIPIYIIDESRRSFLAIVKMAATIVRKQVPQIIHSHRYKENILSHLISFTLKKDAALVSTQHGLPENYDDRPNLVNHLKSKVNYGLLASRFDRVIAVSADVKEALVRDYALQEKHVQVIRNGIVVPETLREFRLKDYFVIGSAGRFFPVKDYPFMVEVAREVIRKNNRIYFELAGEGPMLEQIQGLIKKYKLEEHFTLRGFLHDMSIFYQGINVYLTTSLHEGIPMSVLEAMAYQLPIIAPKVGGLREIITDGVDGYLLNTRNPKDFAEKCLSLYENETLRRKMANAARQKVIREFSMKRMVQDYTNTYMQIISQNEQ